MVLENTSIVLVVMHKDKIEPVVVEEKLRKPLYLESFDKVK